MKSKKILKFNKQDIADLTKEEQRRLVGGLAPTVGPNCTVTCQGKDTCEETYGDTGSDCLSVYRGGCNPESNPAVATCYMSAAEMCHTDHECTFGNCTDTCVVKTYGDQTCLKATCGCP